MFTKRLMAFPLLLIFMVSLWNCKNPHGPDYGSVDLEETGTIGVWSEPIHADIYLDGQPTGARTNVYLEGIKTGTHTIMLRKEGYKDWEEIIVVKAKEEIWVWAKLKTHKITVTSPTSGTVWIKGQEVEITWEVDGSSTLSGNTKSQLNSSQSKREIKVITYVKIELYKGESLVLDIAPDIENNGSFTWTVDSQLEDGSDYKVRVGLALAWAEEYGESGEFTIRESG